MSRWWWGVLILALMAAAYPYATGLWIERQATAWAAAGPALAGYRLSEWEHERGWFRTRARSVWTDPGGKSAWIVRHTAGHGPPSLMDEGVALLHIRSTAYHPGDDTPQFVGETFIGTGEVRGHVQSVDDNATTMLMDGRHIDWEGLEGHFTAAAGERRGRFTARRLRVRDTDLEADEVVLNHRTSAGTESWTVIAAERVRDGAVVASGFRLAWGEDYAGDAGTVALHLDVRVRRWARPDTVAQPVEVVAELKGADAAAYRRARGAALRRLAGGGTWGEVLAHAAPALRTQAPELRLRTLRLGVDEPDLRVEGVVAVAGGLTTGQPLAVIPRLRADLSIRLAPSMVATLRGAVPPGPVAGWLRSRQEGGILVPVNGHYGLDASLAYGELRINERGAPEVLVELVRHALAARY